ncbi:phospholipase D family protein [Lutimaribacter marinistellae]|uniref:Phospholipase D family protein n=1 Tax=Lutimaribacter marinistellae TaxID=1820329 RepID=A0ABV7TKE4_9RHOB
MTDRDTARGDMADPNPITDFHVFWTAQEAFPEFERLCLGARSSVRASFRIFDLDTPLYSREGRAIGKTWFDLVLHKLNQGVSFDVTLSDFDPILATPEHRYSWQSARRMAAVNELSEGASFTFRVAMHPARVGFVPRLALRKRVREEFEARDPDELTPGLRELEDQADLPMVPATHHQKMAVIDSEILWIGGLDLNKRRYDSRDHERAPEQTWQDIQAKLRGPIVASAQQHLESFLDVCDGVVDPPPTAPAFLRTISMRRQQELTFISPRNVVNEIEQAHLTALEEAEGLIYLETQFFRYPPLANALAKAAQRNPDLGCILVVPAAPEDVAFDGNDELDARMAAQKELEAMRILREGFGPRVVVASPAQKRRAKEEFSGAILHDAPIIYVHSKLSLFGTQQAILSSANLNGRSLRWDTEAGIHLTDETHVLMLWQRAITHWFGDMIIDPDEEPQESVLEVAAALEDNHSRPPERRNHFLLPYDSTRAENLAAHVPAVPDELV